MRNKTAIAADSHTVAESGPELLANNALDFFGLGVTPSAFETVLGKE
jgi:hypothetical protein